MNNDNKYTLEDLIQAINTLSHHKAELKECQRVVSMHTAALTSAKDRESTAASTVSECEAKVHKIVSNLKR